MEHVRADVQGAVKLAAYGEGMAQFDALQREEMHRNINANGLRFWSRPVILPEHFV